MPLQKHQVADAAIKAYETLVFSAPGHTSDAVELCIIVLGLDALEACTKASHDRTVNQTTRDYYAREAQWFRAQHG